MHLHIIVPLVAANDTRFQAPALTASLNLSGAKCASTSYLPGPHRLHVLLPKDSFLLALARPSLCHPSRLCM